MVAAGRRSPSLRAGRAASERSSRRSTPQLGERYLYCDGDAPLLFTENETNNERIFGTPNDTPLRQGRHQRLRRARPRRRGEPGQGRDQGRGALPAHRRRRARAGVRLRLTTSPRPVAHASATIRSADFDEMFKPAASEADEFYASITPPLDQRGQASVMRQALAGMLWTKQYYHYDVDKWLEEHGVRSVRGAAHGCAANERWHHMVNGDIISMPDKWEYPWYAAWDLAFHIVALALVDPDFAKQQLDLMLRERYLHPSGQIPAYEWNFGDVNPPVHAWATIFLYRMEQGARGQATSTSSSASSSKLLLNFTWWVNRKDRTGKNVFEGGFLGLDNIGVFDRSAPLPTGGYLEQADGTAWMALFCQNMLELAVELAATTRPTRTWRSSSSTTSSGSPSR